MLRSYNHALLCNFNAIFFFFFLSSSFIIHHATYLWHYLWIQAQPAPLQCRASCLRSLQNNNNKKIHMRKRSLASLKITKKKHTNIINTKMQMQTHIQKYNYWAHKLIINLPGALTREKLIEGTLLMSRSSISCSRMIVALPRSRT